MRTSFLAMIVVAGSAVAFPATAQQQPGPQEAAPSEQTSGQIHRDADKELKTNEPSEQMQRDADKGAKTLPGRPEIGQTTTGSSSQTGGALDKSGGAKGQDKSR